MNYFLITKYCLCMLIVSGQSVMSAPLGWYSKVLIDKKVFDYSVSGNPNGNMYIVTAHLKKPWKKDVVTNVVLKLHSFRGKKTKTSKVTDVKLETAKVFFPLHLSIASNRNDVLIAWQNTNINESVRTKIEYIFSDKGHGHFGDIESLEGDAEDLTTVLPKLKEDSEGRLHIFYQQETQGEGRFTMLHSRWGGSDFSSPTVMVESLQDIGRGAFFPSVVFEGKRIDVFYQSRLGDVPKDEIFRVSSLNGGRSYDDPERLTQNKYNDFSPFGANIEGKLEWVWQARVKNVWSIFYAQDPEKPIKITKTNTGAYFPNLLYLKNMGRIISWYDFRKSPPQIYSVFLDRRGKGSIGRAHNTSLERSVAKQPILIKWRQFGFLFYLVSGRLYAKKIDSDSGKIKIVSKTHPEKKSSSASTGLFKLKLPKDPAGINEIAWIQDRKPDTIPEVYNLSSTQRKIRLRNLSGGDYYLHVRYKDGIGNESEATHYNFIVDNARPSKPVIYSPTHPEGSQSSKRNIVFEFRSEDDSAIKHYRYSFSPNRAARLKKITKDEKIEFKDVPPDVYFFKVQAVDAAGNSSSRGSYQIEIIDSEESLAYSTNLDSQQLKENAFVLEYTPISKNKRIRQAFAVIDTEQKDPSEKGKSYKITSEEDLQSIRIPMKKYPTKRLYTASFRFVFEGDNKSKIKSYSFEYLGSKVRKAVVPRSVKNFRKTAPGKQAKVIKASISAKLINSTDSLYKVKFSIPPSYEKVLRGYIWHLTGVPKILKGKAINSKGGPEYIYNLDSGIYYLTVRPVLKKSSNLKADYSYLRITVPEDYFSQEKRFYYGIMLLCITILLLLRWQSARILFYWRLLLARL